MGMEPKGVFPLFKPNTELSGNASTEEKRALLGSNPYPVQNVCPPFKGDALEDGEERKSEVVEVGDAVVGALPVLAADLPGGLVALIVAAAQRRTVLVDHFAYWQIEVSL